MVGKFEKENMWYRCLPPEEKQTLNTYFTHWYKKESKFLWILNTHFFLEPLFDKKSVDRYFFHT